MPNRLILVFSLLLLALPAFTRANSGNPDSLMNVPIFFTSFSYDYSGGDIAKRFGNNFEIGGGFLYKSKTNWIYGIEMSYLFGETVKEDVLKNIKTSEGQLIGMDGLFADVRISQRGMKLPVIKGGKVFDLHLPKASKNSGLITMFGIGFLQHKINFEDVTKTARQIEGDYRKGYDRLTNGLAITQNIGYLFLDENRIANFFLMTEFTQGFTKNRRTFNFDTMEQDNSSKIDLLYGIKAGWMFPVYKKLPKTFYYN